METDGEARPDLSAVLEGMKGKKEMKAKGKGLVRFRSGEVDSREVSQRHFPYDCRVDGGV
jgi:hypothetical protein